MAGFQTHIGVAGAVGAGYAYWGFHTLNLPLPTCLLAGGFVTIAGIMPDLDSDSGIPARETISFAAAIVPMILMNRLITSGLSSEQLVLVGVPLYLFIRFAVGTLLKRFTVHRGMFHSIPAIAIAGMIGFLLCDSNVHSARIYKTIAVMLGYATHLVLDEIWSVNLSGVAPSLKKSFGTALKLFSNDPTATSATYGLLLLLGLFVLRETSPEVHQRMAGYMPDISRYAANPRVDDGRQRWSAGAPTQRDPQQIPNQQGQPGFWNWNNSSRPPVANDPAAGRYAPSSLQNLPASRDPYAERAANERPLDPSLPAPQQWIPPRSNNDDQRTGGNGRRTGSWSEANRPDEFAPDHFSNGWR